ncbi:hypothetical protein PSA7680_00556 [Pseudoruegeria aquimaris]|uniref:DUF1127 domain-containing protein n=1 Tax=Pseudoruegeria aquimaris TaxID=393663 RepID=A0A1Y5RIX8_9RHOB|nr:DUF1127 domain-containing protein [Pseudoruegeria aquimaris]SLN17515.1 hypothetical protein PSA7680_00556 [Pseudoruegeria aquimaris]
MQTLATPARAAALRPARRSVLSRLLAAEAAWRTRQSLKTLDRAALRDLGLSRSQAAAEAARPIWDVPAAWRC